MRAKSLPYRSGFKLKISLILALGFGFFHTALGQYCTISAPSSAPVNTDVTFTVSSTCANRFSILLWDGGNGQSQNGGTSFTTNFSSVTSYTITLYAECPDIGNPGCPNPGETDGSSFTIQIVNPPPPPPPATTFSHSPDCGQTIVSWITGPNSGISYWWQTDQFGQSEALGSGSSVTLYSNTSLWLRSRLSGPPFSWGGSIPAGPFGSSFISVDPTPKPGTPSSAVNGYRFGSGPVNISASPGSNSDNLRWYTNSLATIAQFDALSHTEALAAPSSKTYYVRSLNSAKQCVSAEAIPLIATAYAIPVITATPPSFNQGSPITLDVGSGFDTYVWKNQGGQIVSASQTYVTAIPGTYTATVTKNGASTTVVKDLLCGQNDNGGCSISSPGTLFCSGQTDIVFTTACTKADIFVWTASNGDTAIGSSFNPRFDAPGTYCIELYAECPDTDTRNCPIIGDWYTYTTVTIIDPLPAPIATATPNSMCENSNVLLEVQNPVAGQEYSWFKQTTASNDYFYVGSGTILNYYVTEHSSFEARYGTELGSPACADETGSVLVLNTKNEQVPVEIDRSYRKSLIGAMPTGIPGHYWQTSLGGTNNDPINSTATNLVATSDGDYFINRFNSSGNCWGTASVLSLTLDYAPPLAEVAEVKKQGYNQVYLTNLDKDFILQHATYYWVSGPSGTETSNSFAQGDKFYVGGEYHLRGLDNMTQTWGPANNLSIQLRSEDGFLNWIYTRGYDGASAESTTSETKSYFDDNGRSLQSQNKNISGNLVFATQSFRDEFDRVVGSTLPASIGSSGFSYNAGFLLTKDDDPLNFSDFDSVDVLDDSYFGTLGWYYSNNNTLEPLTPKTKVPFTRTVFYNEGSSEPKMASGVGEQLRIGFGHEVLTGTFPVHNELDDYLANRALAIPGISSPNASLMHEAVQTVTRDQNGRFVVSLADKSGNSVMSARMGKLDNHVLEVNNSVVGSASSNPLVYLYLFEVQPVGLTGSGGMVIEDILNDNILTPSGDWPAGFYRIRITSGSRTITYTNRYLDVSYNYYDDAGRLISSISPNGSQSLLEAGIAYENEFNQNYDEIQSDGTISMSLSNERLKVQGASQWNAAYLNLPTQVDHVYQVSFFVDLNDGGQIDAFSSGNSQNLSQISITANGTYGHSFKAVGNSTLVLFSNHVGGPVRDFYLDNILIRDLGVDGLAADRTTYQYNHQGWLLSMTETDAGTTRYAYRRDGSIRFSQNAEQQLSGKYSYTNYDESGRPLESGEYIPPIGLLFDEVRNNSFVLETIGDTWMLGSPVQTRLDWVKTHYDLTYPGLAATLPDKVQDFLMGSVSWTENSNIKTWYSYDELGRVHWMAQQPVALSNMVFLTEYTYDFLGNVLTVSNKTRLTGSTTSQSEFHHHYSYDADKRLSEVFTSTDGTTLSKQASYSYYLHGPLKRIELANNLQGIDFVYNINGWLKSINDPSSDPGEDGLPGEHSSFRKDAFGMVLDYYESSLLIFEPTGILKLFDPKDFHNLPGLENNNIEMIADASLPFFRRQLRASLDAIAKQRELAGDDD